MSLQGVLSDFGVADIFQLIAQQRKTGVLSIERKNRNLEVRFRKGGVVRALPKESRPDAALAALLIRLGVVGERNLAEAWRKQEESLESLPRVLVTSGLIDRQVIDEARALLTNETIFELFLWDDGRFSFSPREVEQTNTDAPVGAEMVLLDALRMRDEWTEIQSDLRDLSVVISSRTGLEGFRAACPRIEEATGMSADNLERVFRLIDGRLTARRVIDLARLGTFSGGRALMGMVHEGLCEIEVGAQPVNAPVTHKASPFSGLLGYAILLAGFVLAAGLAGLKPPLAAADFPIPMELSRRVQEASHTQHLWALLETYRWVHGRYPDSLAALPESALAALPVDRYSYALAAGGGYSLQLSLHAKER